MSHLTYTIVEHDGGWAYKSATSSLIRFPSAKRLTLPRNEQRGSSERQGRASRSSMKTAPAVGVRKTKRETIGLTRRSRTKGRRNKTLFGGASARVRLARNIDQSLD
jgi:hypothetical protein